MRSGDALRVDAFLDRFPQMSLRPAGRGWLRLEGVFEFRAHHPDHGRVEDRFEIRIDLPRLYPRELPRVREIGGQIPPHESYHVNPDGTLCLGSDLRLLDQVHRDPSLPTFASEVLVPWFFATSIRLDGGAYVFGELAHGGKGLLDDYQALFGLDSPDQVREAVRLVSTRHRVANKRPCPCGCGRRLGRCDFRFQLSSRRKFADRKFFEEHLAMLSV